jgi:hypothetical protein
MALQSATRRPRGRPSVKARCVLENPGRFDAPGMPFQHFATGLNGTVETIEFVG